MGVGFFHGGICSFDGKRGGKAIQSLFFNVQTVLVEFSLVKEQWNSVVHDSYKIGVIGFHAGKPFMGNYILLFEVIDKVIHSVLKRKKLALFQPSFRNIEIYEGHNKQYGGGGSGA